jgi:hypothetical protein
MIRANVYSQETLQPEVAKAVADGIDVVAGYIGETVSIKELQVRLPHNRYGSVNPNRVGFKKLDGMVELHVMAVPLEYENEATLGVASIGHGFSFIDTNSNNPQVLRSTSAHENAHALGFVVPLSRHEDPASPFHCSDPNCIMNNKIVIFDTLQALAEPISKRNPLTLDKAETDLLRARSLQIANGQNDFCSPCKKDFRDKGSYNIGKLRYGRLVNKGRNQ